MTPELEYRHRLLVQDLKKPDAEILASLLPGDCELIHMGFGICGEAGELLDAINKYVIYRCALDRENVIEELGDLEFFMEGLRQSLGIYREETLQANIDKLRARYPERRYTNHHAIARNDKV